MPGNFVPIVAASPHSAGPQSKTSNKVNILTGFAASKMNAVPLASAAPRTSLPPPCGASAPSFAALSPQGGQNHGAPKITFQKDGDRITQIRVQCPCGQIIELNCVY